MATRLLKSISGMGRLRLCLLLLPVPLFWLAFTELPFFHPYWKRLDNLAMDWRFIMRGEKEVPEVKIVYANVDAPSMSFLGERPWPKDRFALIAEILFREGGARVVGFDFIFSDETYSNLVDMEKAKLSERRLGEVVQQYPNIVLGANYTQSLLPLTWEERQAGTGDGVFYQRRQRIIPLSYMDNVSPEETFPEMPTYPIIGPNWGTIGLISTDMDRSVDSVPRWIPVYTEARGPYYTLHLMDGIQNFAGLSDDNMVEFGGWLRLFTDEGNEVASMPVTTEQRFFHFSLELALKHLGLNDDHVHINKDHLRVVDDEGVLQMEIPLVDGQLLEVNWFSRWDNPVLNPRASVMDIIQRYDNLMGGDEEMKEEARAFFKRFQDAVVLIGPVDPTLQDLAPTPFDASPVPKVGVHGNVMKMLFSGDYIQRPPPWVPPMLLLLLTLIATVAGTWTGRYGLLGKLVSVASMVGYVGLVFFCFNRWHLVIPIVGPVASAATTTGLGALYQLILEERQKSRIKGMFGTYLSPHLVEEMVNSGQEPQLGGVDAYITAYFSDVQSFSAFSELLEPHQLVELMNEYLTGMTDVLQGEGAFVDKYIGDAIVAMFNAPVAMGQHALHACRAALRNQECQLELARKWATEGERWPSIVSHMKTRIGINTGHATVGNMGSSNRFNYTMMGDTVNLAARCESGAKAVGVYILATVDTRREAEEVSDEVVFRFVDRWQVKGRSQPVDMHEVVCLRKNLSQSAEECIRHYEQGLEFYFSQNWDEAIASFEKASALEWNQPDPKSGISTNPSLVMLVRCRTMKMNPPGKDWDGVYVMKTK